ncbi:GIY-YIG nuclease family protein [Clostridium paraputrificum]|uniref:GIY-YIG nuclease family protein n=1 Tax=Clostridium paraputrificum TaxID=29363 RepID=UPI0034A2DF64
MKKREDIKLRLENTVEFTMADEILVPREPGIYFIHDLRGVIYVGRTENLLQRYRQHLYLEKNNKLKDYYRNPIDKMKFSWIYSKYPEQIELEKKYIRYFKPYCNSIYNKNNKVI